MYRKVVLCLFVLAAIIMLPAMSCGGTDGEVQTGPEIDLAQVAATAEARVEWEVQDVQQMGRDVAQDIVDGRDAIVDAGEELFTPKVFK